jgi:hypothetical protein
MFTLLFLFSFMLQQILSNGCAPCMYDDSMYSCGVFLGDMHCCDGQWYSCVWNIESAHWSCPFQDHCIYELAFFDSGHSNKIQTK